jgi:hypothetical protein
MPRFGSVKNQAKRKHQQTKNYGIIGKQGCFLHFSMIQLILTQGNKMGVGQYLRSR